MNMGAIGCPEKSVTTNLRCVISQKGEGPIDTASEAWCDTTISFLTQTFWASISDSVNAESVGVQVLV